MVVVDGSGVGDGGYVGGYELKDGYLGGSILVGNVVGVKFEVGDIMFDFLFMGIV